MTTNVSTNQISWNNHLGNDCCKANELYGSGPTEHEALLLATQELVPEKLLKCSEQSSRGVPKGDGLTTIEESEEKSDYTTTPGFCGWKQELGSTKSIPKKFGFSSTDIIMMYNTDGKVDKDIV